MDETNKLETLEREVTDLKKNQETLRSEVTAAIAKINDAIATKTNEINDLRASVEELKRSYSIEEAENEPAENEEGADESAD
jgi:predicted  nucleic acid-binding Zn-ribbon protein